MQFVFSRTHLLSQAESDAAIATSLGGLGATPYVVLGCYLLLLLALGVYGWLRSTTGEEDYYLAGREQGWIISSLTIMATFFSSFALLGAPGMVYKEGVVFALFSLNVPVAGMCVYLFGARIWKLGRRFGYVTPGDMIGDYYGSRFSLRALVAVSGVLYAIPYVVMQILAGGLISQKLFGESSFAAGASVLAVITMLYIMIGGMRSVAWTDLVQGVLLIAGMLVGGFAMFLVFDGPANFGNRVVNELPAGSLTAPGNTGVWQWTMVLTVCLLASSGSMVQPAQWMRYDAARSPQTLKRAALIFAVVLTTCFILGVMLIGLAGQVLYPLHRGLVAPVPQGPSQVAIPPSLASRLRYAAPRVEGQDGQLILSWPLTDAPRILSPAEWRELESQNASPALSAAVLQLSSEDAADASLMPNPTVDPNPTDRQDYDSILVVVLNQQLPRVLGRFGALFASLMIVAIMAASMSTADSNLHALSALLTRDVYDQFVRPNASESERVWVGRIVIAGATALSLAIVFAGRTPEISEKYDFLNMLATMGLMAIAFSAQLLPIAVDICFIRRGGKWGAVTGLAAGLLAAFAFGPLLTVLTASLGSPPALTSLAGWIDWTKSLLTINGVRYGVHGSVWGLIFNVAVFVLVSTFTPAVPDERRNAFARELGDG